MPDLDVYAGLKKKGIDLDSGDSGRFNTLDILASTEGLEALFSTLINIYVIEPVDFTGLKIASNESTMLNKINLQEFRIKFYS